MIEDMEIEEFGRKYRRRLRFKTIPNLVQCEISIVPIDSSTSFFEMKFVPDFSCLVSTHLPSMAAGLCFINHRLQDTIDSDINPRALCLGVGGMTLLGFLATLGFDVYGLDIDEVVPKVAEEEFGLEQYESAHLQVEDAIEFFKDAKCIKTNRFDAIMVYLTASDYRTKDNVPPLAFMQETILLFVKACSSDSGCLILNVIPKDKVVYVELKGLLNDLFEELCEINTANGVNMVVSYNVTDESIA